MAQYYTSADSIPPTLLIKDSELAHAFQRIREYEQVVFKNHKERLAQEAAWKNFSDQYDALLQKYTAAVEELARQVQLAKQQKGDSESKIHHLTERLFQEIASQEEHEDVWVEERNRAVLSQQEVYELKQQLASQQEMIACYRDLLSLDYYDVTSADLDDDMEPGDDVLSVAPTGSDDSDSDYIMVGPDLSLSV